MKNLTGCSNKNDQGDNNLTFTGGKSTSQSFSSSEVGLYEFSIKEKDWTAIDQNSNNLGCNLDSGNNDNRINGKYGCDIVTKTPENISLKIMPAKFEFNNITSDSNLRKSNLPNSNRIYMEDISNSIDNSEGFLIKGKIKALGKNNGMLFNYTNQCMAEKVNVSLTLDKNLRSSETKSGFPLQYDIIISDPNNRNLEQNNLEDLNLSKDIFQKNGEGNFSILINIKKNISDESNPITLHFEELLAKSVSS